MTGGGRPGTDTSYTWAGRFRSRRRTLGLVSDRPRSPTSPGAVAQVHADRVDDCARRRNRPLRAAGTAARTTTAAPSARPSEVVWARIVIAAGRRAARGRCGTARRPGRGRARRPPTSTTATAVRSVTSMRTRSGQARDTSPTRPVRAPRRGLDGVEVGGGQRHVRRDLGGRPRPRPRTAPRSRGPPRCCTARTDEKNTSQTAAGHQPDHGEDGEDPAQDHPAASALTALEPPAGGAARLCWRWRARVRTGITASVGSTAWACRSSLLLALREEHQDLGPDQRHVARTEGEDDVAGSGDLDERRGRGGAAARSGPAPAAAGRARRRVAPLTPGSGSSRATYTSMTTTSSAAPSARPSPGRRSGCARPGAAGRPPRAGPRRRPSAAAWRSPAISLGWWA